jgi:putative MATE family efflux protein
MRKPTRDLTEGGILRNIWHISLPIMVGNMLQNTFNIVDMIFVGKLGPAAIAAVGMSGVIMGILYVAIFGIYMGTTAMVARFIGAKEKTKAENVAMQSVLLGLFCYVVISIAGYTLSGPMLKGLGASDEVLIHGIKYIRVMFIGSIMMILSFILGSALRAAGDALTPMVILAISTVLNIGLDPLLIFGLWRFPELGVAGSAVATVIARAIGVSILLWLFLKDKAIIRLRIANAKIDLPLMGRIMRIGIFASIQGILRNVSGLILTRIVATYGTFAVAAYVVGMRLQFIVLMPGFGLATAVATLVGQNLGAKKPERAARTAWITVGIGAGIMAFLGLIYIIFARSIIGVFNDHPEVLKVGVVYLRILASTFGIIAFGIILGRALNGAGDTVSPMVITAVGLLGFRIGLSLILTQSLGLMGIWIGIASSSIIQGLMVTVWFSTGRWKLKKV